MASKRARTVLTSGGLVPVMDMGGGQHSVFAKAPTWLVAAGLWALWLAEPDPVSKRLAAIAGRSVAVLAVLDAMRFAMDNDPAPLLIALLVAIQIGTSRA